MKSLGLIAVILLFNTAAFAGPFLVCDPPNQSEQVTHYTIYKDGELLADNVIVDQSGSYGFKYDLAGIDPGQYTWTATAHNAWGSSDPSDPYTSPSAALKPMNPRMEE